MSTRDTVIRSLHDVGAAVWLGGSLMGAVGLNGAASDIADPYERAATAAAGWARWAPVNAAAIGMHLAGGIGLLVTNRNRLRNQEGAAANSALKTVLTGVALAATADSGRLGSRIAAVGRRVPADAATTPASTTPEGISEAQQRLQTIAILGFALAEALAIIGLALAFVL